MSETEKQCYETISPVVNLFWVPATWFDSVLCDAVKEGYLTNDSGNKLIMEVSGIIGYKQYAILLHYCQEFLDFRAQCGAVWSYNWVSIPMVYTQVLT